MTTTPTPAQTLHTKIHDRTATIGIVGLGYVGLPLALLFHERGFPIIGFDTDPEKPAKLQRGESYIRHIGADAIGRAFTSEKVRATSDFAHLSECDAILICVPTPLGRASRAGPLVRPDDGRGGCGESAPRTARGAGIDDLSGNDARGRAAAARAGGSSET